MSEKSETLSEWNTELQELHDKLSRLNVEFLSFCYKFQAKVKSFSPDEPEDFPEICDIGFQFREFADLADNVKKTGNAWEKKLSAVLCMGMMARCINAGEDVVVPVHGLLASGSAKFQVQPKLPKRDTPEFYALAEYFGISADSAKYFDPHFTELTELLTTLAEQGKPMPPGIDSKYSSYGMSYRRKKID